MDENQISQIIVRGAAGSELRGIHWDYQAAQVDQPGLIETELPAGVFFEIRIVERNIEEAHAS